VADASTGAGIEATITVYDAGTTDTSTIYSTQAGGSQDNPFDTDEYGRFVFYADPGIYDIQVSGADIDTYKLEDVSIMPVSSPPDGMYRVTNFYVRPEGTKLEVEYETP